MSPLDVSPPFFIARSTGLRRFADRQVREILGGICPELVPEVCESIEELNDVERIEEPMSRIFEFLRENGCDELQGYLFSPAVPPEQFEQFLEKEKPE